MGGSSVCGSLPDDVAFYEVGDFVGGVERKDRRPLGQSFGGCIADQRQEFVRRLLTLQRLDSAVAFLAVASRTFSRKPDATGRRGIIVSGSDYGTVSSTLVSLPSKMQNSVYQYAPGPPSDNGYDDLSALLRQVLSTDR